MENKELKKIVTEVIKKECKKEALEILKLSPAKGVNEFIEYYKKKEFNTCCMHLDWLKCNLIKEDKMEKGGYFGNPFDED